VVFMDTGTGSVGKGALALFGVVTLPGVDFLLLRPLPLPGVPAPGK